MYVYNIYVYNTCTIYTIYIHYICISWLSLLHHLDAYSYCIIGRCRTGEVHYGRYLCIYVICSVYTNCRYPYCIYIHLYIYIHVISFAIAYSMSEEMFLTSLLSLNIWPAREEKDEPLSRRIGALSTCKAL